MDSILGSLRSLLVVLPLLFFSIDANNITKIFNVKDFGAAIDGKTDSTEAFLSAWNAACGSDGQPRFLIPEGTFIVGPLQLKGPCKAPMTVMVKGAVVAPTDLGRFPTTDWIHFKYIDGLVVVGSGRFDGQGATAWPHNHCPQQKKCNQLPTSIKFSFVTNATIRGISSINSKQFHMLIFSSKNIKIRNIKISAPGDSPNTDGIHIGISSNISIARSMIGTGDDCISIGAGNADVSISDVFCGPGHGISVGSLGKTPGEGDVSGLTVRNCTLTNTTNGMRIKSWEGYQVETSASNFKFEDIVMRNVENPIIIDQQYCPSGSCNHQSPSQVKISNIKFENIRGTSATKVAVNLLCSEDVPCRNIELNNINLEYEGSDGAAIASCTNVKGTTVGSIVPQSCI